MAWTAKIKAVEKQGGKIHVVINYSDGQTTFDEDFFTTSPRTLNDIVASRVTELTTLDTYFTTLASGAVISQTPTPPIAVPPAAINKAAWFRDWGRLQNCNLLITAGILTGLEPAYTTLKQSVKDNFLPAYIADM